MKALSTVLCKLEPGLVPFVAGYEILIGLQSSNFFAAIKVQTDSCLLSVLGNAAAIATSLLLLENFISLPQAALLTLLPSNQLVTEATLLLLLNEWGKEQIG